jgi:hypothetical protein
MNCTAFKIWLDKASVEELKTPGKDLSEHLTSCHACNTEYTSLVLTFEIIEAQKELSLSQGQTDRIVQNLVHKAPGKQNDKSILRLNKMAAVIIIVFGLITGAIAGNLLSDLKNKNAETPWESEFSLLSDNSDYESYLFD